VTEETIRRVIAESPIHGTLAVEEVQILRRSVASLLEKLTWALGELGMDEKEIAKIPAVQETKKFLAE
jgi:predicted Ser/Thr protein kinase